MKSVLNKCCKPEGKPFPKLMKSNVSGVIVLMTGVSSLPGNFGRGTIVNGTNVRNEGIGFYSSMWGLTSFEDYNGSVTLEN